MVDKPHPTFSSPRTDFSLPRAEIYFAFFSAVLLQQLPFGMSYSGDKIQSIHPGTKQCSWRYQETQGPCPHRASLLVGERTNKQMHICGGMMSNGINAMKKNTAGIGRERWR